MKARLLPLALAVLAFVAPSAGAQPHAQPLPRPPADEHKGPDGHGNHPAPAAGHERHEGHESAAAPAPAAADPHAGHGTSAPAPADVALPAFIAPVTEEMRRAAFPDVRRHAAHDRAINTFVLVDQLESRWGSGVPGGASWSSSGWIGGDVNRLWFRTEGDGSDRAIDDAEAHVLYGRAIARWWDVVAGVRQDVRPGAQTWLAFGVQGLAPGFFDVEATAYVSDAGQTAARLELEYDVLLTNRLVLQPTVEVNVYGKGNPSLGVGSGLSSGEAGVRLRYEIRREFAPYVGITWGRTFGRTRDLADRDAPNGRPRLVAGVRLWR